MKTRIIFELAAIGLLASCAKEQVVSNDSVLPAAPVGVTTLTVGLAEPQAVEPQHTKTHMDIVLMDGKHKVYWSNGDQIAVNGVSSDPLSELPEYSQTAEFNIEAVLSTPYNIVYPASIYTDATHVALPAIQDYRAGGFAEGMYPMAGYSAGGQGITLGYLGALVKISVLRASAAADEDNLIAVRFKGRNGEQVSGAFTIDYENVALTATSSAAADKEVRVIKTMETSTASACVYYVVVPAGTYSNGFDIIVQDVNGHIMTQSKTESTTLVAGHLYAMPEFAFVPTATELGVEISNASQLVAFSQDYKNGVYDSLGDALVVSLTDDIVFDAATSAAFNATGGIGDPGTGEDTHYFHGVFDGNNHSISHFDATVPLFAYTGSAGQIKNVNLDNTCSLTIPAAATDVYHAAIVGRHKGSMSGCSSAVSMNIQNIESINTASQYYGLLVGRVFGGSVSGCSATGDIVCAQTGASLSVANAAYIGGISAYMDGTGSSISSSDFTGSITISDGSSDYTGIVSSVNALYFYVGGIVGYASGTGSIAYCNDSAPSGTPGSIDVRGTFVPGVGGVAGWVESTSCAVNHCNNYMSLSFKSSGARTATTPCRVGGIAGRSKGDVSSCDNNGAISTICNSTSIYLGGIAGDGVNFYHCNNNAGGAISRTNQLEATSAQTNRYHYLGGIVGANVAAAEIEDCHNYAKILNNTPGVATNAMIDMGGIIGYAGASDATDVIPVIVSSCSNEGEVVLDNDVTTAVAFARTSLGGVVGYLDTKGAGTQVVSSSNAGKIWCNNNASGSYGPMCIGGTVGKTAAVSSIENCSNSGAILCSNVGASAKTTVDLGGIVGWASATISITGTQPAGTQQYTQNSGTIDVSDGGSTAYARTSLGGIIGFGNGANSTVSYCKNSAQIHCTYSTNKKDGRVSYIGGIIGVMAGLTYNSDGTPKSFGALDGPEIGHCNNTGAVWTQNYNNSAGNKTGAFAGGIVGAIAGNTGDNNASIHDCTSSKGNLTIYRGNGGGIAAYAAYAVLSQNTASQTLTGNNNATDAAGILGSAVNGTSISDCTFTGSVGAVMNVAGICYSLDGTSSISGCKVNGATITKGTNAAATDPAVLVYTAASGSTIADCGVKGKLEGAAITLDSRMVTSNSGTISGTYLIE
ncbi:MAG: hypothetical protein J6X69_08965 [Bacteroidales bacterium]|nr:hypothetical protein [Bacteroidales bacterium]